MLAVVDTRREYDDLWFHVYLPVFAATIAIVFALVLFAVVRFRRRDERLPDQKDERPVAEGLYTLGLVAVAALLFAFTFRTEQRIDRVDKGVRVDIRAFQWQWRFTYPGSGVTVVGSHNRAAVMAVPTRTTVHFTISSQDVIHSFWVPALRFKKDANPFSVNEFDLYFAKRGTYDGRCSEFCGLRHTDMQFTVRALPRDQFRSWLAAHRRSRQ